MNRYQHGKIYKISNTVNEKIYIGSTCSPLEVRLYQHKQHARQAPARLVYAELLSVGLENVLIELLEICPRDNKKDILTREQHYINELKPALNKNNPAGLPKICEHGRYRFNCKECKGKAICEHLKQREACKICCGCTCYVCGIETSKRKFKQHLKTRKHTRNAAIGGYQNRQDIN